MNENHFEEINAFYYGNMDAEQKALFEAKLILNKSLANDFDEFKTTLERFKAENIHQLKAQFQKLDEQLNKTLVVKPVYNFTKYFAIAASFAFLFLVVWLGYNKYNDNNFSAYEIKEAGLPVLMGVNDKIEFDNAMSLYKMNKFEESAAILLKLNQNFVNDTTSYFLGVNYYELENYTQAKLNFISIPANSVFYNKSQYFLGFSYLKQGEKEKAISYFKKLSAIDNDLQDNAKNILKKLSQ